ncbi:hypothetical protein DVH05_013304 [Phytophthora capsici]|nr:hypothetical protein DVH05_013304 [Phytophthora capsici]
MMLQLQEYRTRVHSAFQSTYRHPLSPATPRTGKRNVHSGSYCRTRVLESSRQLFAKDSRAPTPTITPTASPPRSTIKGGGVAFHRTTTSSRTATKSNLFALGPGQYDVIPRRPATTGSVKFSPADRFREHSGGGSTDPHAPGPGQYLPNDRITAKRSARVVFSQIPRQTETAEPPRASVTVASATANVVSSYYYVPASGFESPGDKVGGGIPIWSRSARFPGRREHFQQQFRPKSPAVDYISRNKARIESMSADQRQRRRIQLSAAKKHKMEGLEPENRRVSSVKRRNTLFCMSMGATSLVTRQPSSVKEDMKEFETKETISQAWGTLVVLSVAQTKLVRLLVVAAVLRRLRQAQETRYKRLVLESWIHVRDRDVMRSLAAALIARSTFRFRLNLRVERKIRAGQLLRIFLSGLSMDVRFAMAVRRMQRRIILLQRWWRRARLVVRAREQCLAYKWLVVEQRLRTDAIARMPHLQRIFQPPTAVSAPSNVAKRRASVANAIDPQLPIHKLLNLPEQRRWFNARFVLSPDGILRGFSTDKTLVVEVKNFRCHAHGFANISMGFMPEDEGESDSRPYLMIFRPGASRFLLITSLVLAPLLDWKDKLERIASGSPFPGGSQSDIADMLAQTEIPLENMTESSSRRMSISCGSGERSPSTSQGRRRSSQYRLRRSNMSQPVAEGEMIYYVVDLLRDCPRVPASIVWTALRDKLREERKKFRSEIYRFRLETTRYHQHERERQQLVVLDKFKEFFVRF